MKTFEQYIKDKKELIKGKLKSHVGSAVSPYSSFIEGIIDDYYNFHTAPNSTKDDLDGAERFLNNKKSELSNILGISDDSSDAMEEIIIEEIAEEEIYGEEIVVGTIIRKQIAKEQIANEQIAKEQIHVKEILGEEIAGIFYYLYKIDCVKEAVENFKKQSNCKLTRATIDPVFNKNNFMGCFSGDRTLHVVQVMNGIGDLVHFANWIEAYANLHNDADNIDVLIFHEGEQKKIEGFLENLEGTHPLKNIKDVGIYNNACSEFLIYGKLFSHLFNKKQPYKVLYSISVPCFLTNTLEKFNYLNNIGLKTCLINEIGAKQTAAKAAKSMMPKNCHIYSFGVGNNLYNDVVGCFFSDLPRENEEKIILNISDNLKTKLYGIDADKISDQELMSKAKKTRIIAGYYQNDVYSDLIDNLLKNLNQENVVLFLTGQKEIPWGLSDINEQYQKLTVNCCYLDKKDYQDLKRIIKSSERHFFLCSGDNTFIESLSLGKMPLHLKRGMGIDKTTDFDVFMSQIYRELEDYPEKQEQINSIKKFIVSNAKSEIPSQEAISFFSEGICGFIRANFDLRKRLLDLVTAVEHNNKYSLNECNIKRFLDDKQKQNHKQKNFPCFIVKHYENLSKKVSFKSLVSMQQQKSDFSYKITR